MELNYKDRLRLLACRPMTVTDSQLLELGRRYHKPYKTVVRDYEQTLLED